jgi:hypothetical protein
MSCGVHHHPANVYEDETTTLSTDGRDKSTPLAMDVQMGDYIVVGDRPLSLRQMGKLPPKG